jgi:hypothetical protein
MRTTTRSPTQEAVPIRGEWLSLLLLAQIGCAPDVTSPQSAAAVSRVVPIAVPDVWCPANRTPEDTLAVTGLPACHTSVDVPPPPAPRDSTTWRAIRPLPRSSNDSTREVPTN